MARITVIVPTFERVAALSEAIASVLAQDFADFELLIADNASTDATPELVAAVSDARVRYVRRAQNCGWRENFRRSLRNFRSEYVLVLCDDDRLLPGGLTRAIGLLDEQPRVGLVHSAFDVIDAHGTLLRKADDRMGGTHRDCVERGRDFVLRAMSGNPVCFSTAVMRTAAMPPECFEAVDDTFGDLVLYLRISLGWDIGFLAAPGAEVRIHAGRISSSLDPVESAVRLEVSKLRVVAEHASRLAPVAPLRREARRSTRRTLSGAVAIAGDTSRARGVRLLGRAVRARPRLAVTPRVWLACAKLAVGPRMLAKVRDRGTAATGTMAAGDLP